METHPTMRQGVNDLRSNPEVSGQPIGRIAYDVVERAWFGSGERHELSQPTAALHCVAGLSHITADAVFGNRPPILMGCLPAAGDLLGNCSIALRLRA